MKPVQKSDVGSTPASSLPSHTKPSRLAASSAVSRSAPGPPGRTVSAKPAPFCLLVISEKKAFWSQTSSGPLSLASHACASPDARGRAKTTPMFIV